MHNDDVRFEHNDINAVAVVGTGLGVLIATLLTVFVIWFVFAYFRDSHPKQEGRPGLGPVFGRIRQPLLQSSPRADLEALRARDHRLLNEYNWVDRSKGIVSIPINRAIDKLVAEGMPPRRNYSDLKLYPPREGARHTGF